MEENKQILLTQLMNKREQEQFAAFFEEIYQTEELLDFIKLQLVQSSSYNPNLIFDLISAKNETISLHQLRTYMIDKVACNQRQLYEIFERFDWSRQGSISRNDFLNEMVPFGRQVQSLSLTGGALTAEIEGHFISLLIEILKRFRIVEVVRKQIKYIQPYDAFQQIDYHKTGFIGIPELRKFFFENDFNVTDQQLYYLLHGLRRRCYRDINLEVFCENLEPLESGFYLAYQNRIDEEREIDYLNQSRQEEEVIKRSRVQAQRIQHQFQKAERKKQAELERHLQLEDRVEGQILRHEEEKERHIRRALLQEDRSIRYNIASGGELYHQQILQNQYERLQNQRLNSIRLRQEELNATLSASAKLRQEQLQRSRRTIERQRQMLYQQDLEREKIQIRNEMAARQFELSRRRIEEESRRRYELDLSRKIEEQSRRRYEDEALKRQKEEQAYQVMLQASRRQIAESRRLREEEDRKLEALRRKAYESSSSEQKRIYRQLQLERERAREQIALIRSNRIAQYEKELEKTRYDAIDRSRKTADISASHR